MKIYFVGIALILFLVGCDNDAQKQKEEAIKHIENQMAIVIREAASRNMLSNAERYARLCDFEYNLHWCKGYFIAVYASIESNGAEVCAPRYKKSNKVLFEPAWEMVKTSLLKLPEGSKVRFYESTVSALTEDENCH